MSLVVPVRQLTGVISHVRALPPEVRGRAVAAEFLFHFYATMIAAWVAVCGVRSWSVLIYVICAGLAIDTLRHCVSPEFHFSPAALGAAIRSAQSDERTLDRLNHRVRFYVLPVFGLWFAYAIFFVSVVNPAENSPLPKFVDLLAPLGRELIKGIPTGIDL
jgi:hypothetical protein